MRPVAQNWRSHSFAPLFALKQRTCSRSCSVPLDAVSSRQADARENGLALMARAGAVVTNAESVVFYALQRAGTERFKRLQALIK